VRFSVKPSGAGLQNKTLEVLNENRQVIVNDGEWKDDFEPYAVHIYRIKK
jgi:hypothetical protein